VTANVLHADEPAKSNGWRAKGTLAREVTLIAAAALLYTLVRGLTSDRIAGCSSGGPGSTRGSATQSLPRAR
jgi:hypothetical protein